MKKIGYSFSIIFILGLIFIGPWPIDDEPFEKTQYAQQTFNKINQLSFSKKISSINAGYAKRDITPRIGSPIGGYSARTPKDNTGSYENVFVKAITIENAETSVTIVNSEILLPLPELVAAVTQKSGLKRDELFFTSTHTHSGPGGYASGFIAQQSLGDYSSAYFSFLVNQFSDAISESRRQLTPAKLDYSNAKLSPELMNKLAFNQLEPQKPAHNTFQLLRILRNNDNKNIASIITFSAHPTFFGRQSKKISGDYPSSLMKKLESELGGGVLFIPGGVGGTLPKINGTKSSTTPHISNQQRYHYSEQLLELTKSILINDARIGEITNLRSSTVAINSFLIPVLLPQANFRITDSLRLSPLLVNAIFHDSQSYIHVLQLGKLIFFSYPADYSGDLAADLEQYALKQGLFAWVISFNGDYIGYLTPSTLYSLDHHITRSSNIYGPFGGDYFTEASKNIVDKLR